MSYEDPFPEPGRYVIDVEAEGRLESYEWTVSDENPVSVEMVFEPDGWSLSELRE